MKAPLLSRRLAPAPARSQQRAPGAPGYGPAWGPGRKQGFGAAPGLETRLWYTIADGNLSEVFFPRLDRPALHGLRFLAAAAGSPPIDDAREAEHEVSWLKPGVPAFRIVSRHPEYWLAKELVADVELNGLLLAGDFAPELPDLRLYLQGSAHLQPESRGNSAFILDLEPPVLVMQQADVFIAVVGPFARASAGFVGASDLYRDLVDNEGSMTQMYADATLGNAAVGAEIGVPGGRFQLALGCGRSREEAEEVAREVLQRGLGALTEAFERAWFEASDLPRDLVRVSGDGGALGQCSLAVLKCLEDKSERGAFIAAPAAPWGESQHLGDHVYHLVWPRDLVHMATALIDAGEPGAGQRALRYLERIQRRGGGWPQNCRLDGTPQRSGVELDQAALPILLAWRLGAAGALDHDPYPALVRDAASFIVSNGPGTELDRWEDAGGLSASTLADCIAALAAAEEFAYDAGDHLAAIHLRAVADYWADRIEAWCYDRERQGYVRLAADPDQGPQAGDVLGVDFVELVRRGLRPADHPFVVRTLQHVDLVLRHDTPRGPAWRRYAGDEYGEHPDGRPWDGHGQGRPWPLLTAERGQHSLALGEGAGAYINALEQLAGPYFLLPEQVWDANPIPAAGLRPGEATNSVSPLGWAHAEYLKLLAAVARGASSDPVQPARRRYVEGPKGAPAFVWSHAHRVRYFAAGRSVKIQLPEQALVHWTADRWVTEREVEATDTNLGVWVAELPTGIMRPGAVMEWTAEYAERMEGTNYRLMCRSE